jgi:hypothetical protein
MQLSYTSRDHWEPEFVIWKRKCFWLAFSFGLSFAANLIFFFGFIYLTGR